MTQTEEVNTLVKNIRDFSKIVEKQRLFFNSGQTKPYLFRVKQLQTLKEALIKHTSNLQDALYKDLKKSPFESYTAEIGITISDIEYNIKNLKKWITPKRVHTPLFFQPGKSKILFEPYGVSLIISPWNYPVKNLLGPALGSMAAGNTIILKPSEISFHTSQAVANMIQEYFPAEYMTVIEGGAQESEKLLQEKFDHIFFTGGTEIGKIIYQAAAKNLTPCTLELGGKSPTVVDKNISLDVAAKRIVWGKFYNTGQTCVAPDYVLVHKDIKEAFTQKLAQYVKRFFTENPNNSKDYGRIISQKHFQRLKSLIKGDVLIGGDSNEEEKYIAPTIINNVSEDAPVMQQEIFGPILPILEFSHVQEATDFINKREKPLALYIFSNDTTFIDFIVQNTSSGGVCVNETIMHMVPPQMPFGGVGNSGLGGAYNGFYGFETFSHKKPIMKKSFALDSDFKYPPYTTKKQNFIKFAIRKLI